MAHVLVFQEIPYIRNILATVLEYEGHAVTSVGTMEDALMVLRTSLHPLVLVTQFLPPPRHLLGSFFGTVCDQPEYYGQHRYIAICGWSLPDDEQELLRTLNVYQLHIPFPIDELVALVSKAAASLG